MVDERGKSHWLVTCSCGWGRECVSAWQAQAAAKLHQRLGDLDVKHAVRVEALEPSRGSQPRCSRVERYTYATGCMPTTPGYARRGGLP